MLKIPNYEVIFLDLDGVLHPVDAVEQEFFSESCVFALRRLVDSCNAQVVLSSTWSSGLKVMECHGKNGTQHGFGEKCIFMNWFWIRQGLPHFADKQGLPPLNGWHVMSPLSSYFVNLSRQMSSTRISRVWGDCLHSCAKMHTCSLQKEPCKSLETHQEAAVAQNLIRKWLHQLDFRMFSPCSNPL